VEYTAPADVVLVSSATQDEDMLTALGGNHFLAIGSSERDIDYERVLEKSLEQSQAQQGQKHDRQVYPLAPPQQAADEAFDHHQQQQQQQLHSTSSSTL